MFGEVPPAELHNVDIASFYPTERYIQKLVLGIEPVQSGSGDPSPDNVRPITGYTGVNVFRTGAFNLGADFMGDGYEDGVFLTNTGGITNNSGYFASGYIPVVENDVLYFIINASLNNPSLCFYNSDKTFISGVKYATRSKFTETAPANCAFVRMSVLKTSQNEQGFYDHYTAYPISWQSEAGTVYAGYCSIDKDGNVTLTATHRYVKIDENSSVIADLSWNPNSPCFYINVGSSNKGYWEGTSAISDIISDTLVVTSYNVVRNTGNPYYVAFTGQGVSIEWTSASVDLTAEKARLSSTPINLIYRLATPVTYTLTPVTPIATIRPGINNVWCDTGPIIELIS